MKTVFQKRDIFDSLSKGNTNKLCKGTTTSREFLDNLNVDL